MRRRFVLILESPDAGAPAEVRLRALLKAAGRCFGLRCVRVAESPPEPDPASAPPDSPRKLDRRAPGSAKSPRAGSAP